MYELTDYGAQLEEVVYAMARWGVRTLGPPGPRRRPRAGLGPERLPGALQSHRRRGTCSGTYAFRISNNAFTVSLADGRVSAELGVDPEADLEAAFDMETFFGLASGELAPADAVEQGLVELRGDVECLERFFEAFSYAPRIVARSHEPVVV